MAVKICQNNGRCLVCNTLTFDKVSEAVSGGNTWLCCPKSEGDSYSFCVRVDEISSYEDIPKRPDPGDGKPVDPNIPFEGGDQVAAKAKVSK